MTENPPPALPKRGLPALAKGAIVLAVLLLVMGGLWWWINRPIRPVILTAQEKATVEAKVEAIQQPQAAATPPAEPKYQKGSREIVLTERELNGLLNENTSLGKTVSFELATDAVHARVETDLDPDLPVIGGRHLKARARFFVKNAPGQSSFVLDDVTIWGVSLPNDWLGGLKGRDLLGEVLGGGKNGKIAGVEEFKVEPGKLTIRLAE
ncbi:hypothetical protein JIN84_04150 [Luteolibacter yonseiensis]|uniref:Uncharacterized protein n=1 Tax=Luteolibacter yonseiensis TaxID=1144680 RepID=A0A934V698_9BACT|nr:hypothetical protein [Luteolibacter yonseiensis]MBK1814792.1 hypothetical protein [Luteolibacter yonseiensis]